MPEPHRSAHDGYLAHHHETGMIGVGREVVGRRKDGSLFPADLALSETFDGDDRIFIGVVRDITERKRAAEAIGRLAAIVESTDASIMSMTLDGTVVTWNAGSETLYGYRADEIVGKHISSIASEDRKHEAPRNATDALANGRAAYETVRQHKDGSDIDVAVVLTPVRSGRGCSSARRVSDGDRAADPIAGTAGRGRGRVTVLILAGG